MTTYCVAQTQCQSRRIVSPVRRDRKAIPCGIWLLQQLQMKTEVEIINKQLKCLVVSSHARLRELSCTVMLQDVISAVRKITDFNSVERTPSGLSVM